MLSCPDMTELRRSHDVVIAAASLRHICRGFLVAARCYASEALAVTRCLSVCPSVCPLSVCHIFKSFSPSASHTILVFLRTKRHDNIPTGPAITEGGRMQVGQVEIAILSLYLHGFTACCQRCNRPGVINTTPPDHGPASCDTYRW